MLRAGFLDVLFFEGEDRQIVEDIVLIVHDISSCKNGEHLKKPAHAFKRSSGSFRGAQICRLQCLNMDVDDALRDPTKTHHQTSAAQKDRIVEHISPSH